MNLELAILRINKSILSDKKSKDCQNKFERYKNQPSKLASISSATLNVMRDFG